MTSLPDFIDKVDYSWDGQPHNSSSRAVYSRGQEFVNLARNPRGVGGLTWSNSDPNLWYRITNHTIHSTIPHPLGFTTGVIFSPLSTNYVSFSSFSIDGLSTSGGLDRHASVWIYTWVDNAQARFTSIHPWVDIPTAEWFQLKTPSPVPANRYVGLTVQTKDVETEGATIATGLMVWEDGTEEPPGYFDGDSPNEVFSILPWTPYLSWKGSSGESGVDRAVVYLGGLGVPWHGLTAVNESPDTVDIEPYYLDGTKRFDVPSTYEVEGEITAFNLPRELAAYVGQRELFPGFYGANARSRPFSFTYRTGIQGDTPGYKIHLLYNVLMSPTDKEYETHSDSVEASDFSWAFKTSPVRDGLGAGSSSFELDSRYVDPVKLAIIESILYGYGADPPRLPTPDEIAAILAAE